MADWMAGLLVIAYVIAVCWAWRGRESSDADSN